MVITKYHFPTLRTLPHTHNINGVKCTVVTTDTMARYLPSTTYHYENGCKLTIKCQIRQNGMPNHWYPLFFGKDGKEIIVKWGKTYSSKREFNIWIKNFPA